MALSQQTLCMPPGGLVQLFSRGIVYTVKLFVTENSNPLLFKCRKVYIVSLSLMFEPLAW